MCSTFVAKWQKMKKKKNPKNTNMSPNDTCKTHKLFTNSYEFSVTLALCNSPLHLPMNIVGTCNATITNCFLMFEFPTWMCSWQFMITQRQVLLMFSVESYSTVLSVNISQIQKFMVFLCVYFSCNVLSSM